MSALNPTAAGLLGGLCAAVVLAGIFIVLYFMSVRDKHRWERRQAIAAATAFTNDELHSGNHRPTGSNFVNAAFATPVAYSDCITLCHTYYNKPDALLALLQHYVGVAEEAPHLANKIVLQIVDDGSPVDAMEVARAFAAPLAHFREVRMVTILFDTGFNVSGARNTGVLAAPTEVVALLDLSYALDVTSLKSLLQAAAVCSRHPSHLFRLDGPTIRSQSQHLVHRGFYLHTGGQDEDFSGGYAHDGRHFLHRWQEVNGGRVFPLSAPSVVVIPDAAPSEDIPTSLRTTLAARNASIMQAKSALRTSPASFARVPWRLRVLSTAVVDAGAAIALETEKVDATKPAAGEDDMPDYLRDFYAETPTRTPWTSFSQAKKKLILDRALDLAQENIRKHSGGVHRVGSTAAIQQELLEVFGPFAPGGPARLRVHFDDGRGGHIEVQPALAEKAAGTSFYAYSDGWHATQFGGMGKKRLVTDAELLAFVEYANEVRLTFPHLAMPKDGELSDSAPCVFIGH